jgi:L-Ala-D/L-Glu epimerase
MASPVLRGSERARPLTLAGGEQPVAGWIWPRVAPRAAVVLIHGLRSHARWFAATADALADRDLAVYAVDRRGSGSSPGRNGDIHHYRSWFDEVDRMVDAARADHPGVPIHLVGHCFGANVALGAVLCRPDPVASLILLTPGLRISADYRPLDKARVALCGLIAPQRRFPVPQAPALFSADPAVVGWIAADGLGATALSARCLLQIGRMTRWLRRHLDDLAVPLLVVDAARDRISDTAANAALFDRCLPGRVERVTFDAEHFLLAEPCRGDVVDTISRWVDGQHRSGGRATRPAVARPVRAGRADVAVVRAVEVRTAELPFRFTFGHAEAQRAASTNVYVKVVLDDGTVGFGEGVPRPYVTGETAETAAATVTVRHAPALIGASLAGPDDVAPLLDGLAARIGPDVPGAAWCAVELAVLDAAGRRFGRPVSAWLGPTRTTELTYDAVVPFTGRNAVVPLALAIRAAGISQVKVKVGRDVDVDIDRLRLLRRLLGREVDLRVDANGAWTAEETLAVLERMRRFRISLVEQPVAARDLDGLARVTAACPELIAVDESLRTVAEAEALIEAEACDAFNIRVSKCGGLRASRRIADLAVDAGLTVIVGAQVGESGLLSAAGRHLAACLAPRYLEGSAGRLLLRQDLTAEHVVPGWGGRAHLHAGAGLGVTVRADVLDRHTRWRHRVERRTAATTTGERVT